MWQPFRDGDGSPWSAATDALRRRLPESVRLRGREAPEPAEPSLDGMHWVVAGLFAAAAAELLASKTGATPFARTTRMAALVVGPFAGLAHAARAVWPGVTAQRVARLADGLAIGAATLTLAASVLDAARSGEPGLAERLRGRVRVHRNPIAPITFGVTGILGMVLDHEEQQDAALHRRLERRARLLERLLPRRRTVERIVVRI